MIPIALQMARPTYDYNRRRRDTYQAERFRRRLGIVLMLLVGGAIIVTLTYLSLTK